MMGSQDQERGQREGIAGQFPELVGGFPHAPAGKYEGGLHLHPMDLLECRMDHDKFEVHSPLGVPPEHRRIGEPEP